MEVGALLKTFIYLVSTSLFYPTLLLLSAFSLWTILYAGIFCAEWLERARLPKCDPVELPALIRNGNNLNMLPHRVRRFVQQLQSLAEAETTEVEIENLIQHTTLQLQKSLDRLRILVRVAPSLGLIGTLIPMGTGLAALGQGDMSRLSSDLVIAFTTTVVGLAVGITAFVFHAIKQRWVEEDIKNIELATELMGADAEDREK